MEMSTVSVYCGKKSQDYILECPCYRNVYCSDRCKEQNHQKKFAHHKWREYKLLYDQIMVINAHIRLVTICDINGKVLYCDYREDIQNLLLTPEESKKSLELALNTWKIRSKLASKIGKGKYVLAEYEKVKRITMPLGNNHLLYITTDVEADHSSIIGKLEELVSHKQDY
jgi:hypothetical protein